MTDHAEGYPPATVRKAAAFVEALDNLEDTFGVWLRANSRPVWFELEGLVFTVRHDDNGDRIIGLGGDLA